MSSVQVLILLTWLALTLSPTLTHTLNLTLNLTLNRTFSLSLNLSLILTNTLTSTVPVTLTLLTVAHPNTLNLAFTLICILTLTLQNLTLACV